MYAENFNYLLKGLVKLKKIFVSSTFRDMNAERDVIYNVVTSSLNEKARKYGESIFFSDLRWGVSTDSNEFESDVGARKVLSVCLDEINNCKPYIIVLLEQRYG